MPLISRDVRKHAPYIAIDDIASMKAIRLYRASVPVQLANSLALVNDGFFPVWQSKKIDWNQKRPFGTCGYRVQLLNGTTHAVFIGKQYSAPMKDLYDFTR
jgi:hypothetical protein